MPANLTLKGVPDDVCERLKLSAAANYRSLNDEIVARLEAQVLPHGISPQNQLAFIRATTDRLGELVFAHADLDRFKREGRP